MPSARLLIATPPEARRRGGPRRARSTRSPAPWRAAPGRSPSRGCRRSGPVPRLASLLLRRPGPVQAACPPPRTDPSTLYRLPRRLDLERGRGQWLVHLDVADVAARRRLEVQQAGHGELRLPDG